MNNKERIAEARHAYDNQDRDTGGVYRALSVIPGLICALEKAEEELAKYKKTFCESAEKQPDGKCLGYGRSETDDEPCEQCKACPVNTAYEPEDELKTIQEWAALDHLKIYDPDGFDRSDPLLWERKITKEDYLAGIWRCTVCMHPESPTEEDKPHE